MDDNLFDDDDALDYIMYEECNNETNNQRNSRGCFGTIMFFLVSPVTGLLFWKWH